MIVNNEIPFEEVDIKKAFETFKEGIPELHLQVNNIKDIAKIFDKIIDKNDPELTKLFIKYSDLKYESTLQEKWIAYCIGYQRGLEEGKK